MLLVFFSNKQSNKRGWNPARGFQPYFYHQKNFYRTATFSVKRYVVFDKTTRHFPQNDTSFWGWWSIFNSIHCDTCDSKKTKLLVRERAYARANIFGQYPSIPSSNQTNPSTPPPFRISLKKHSPTKKYSSAMKQPSTNQQWNKHRQIIAQNQYSFALLTHLFRKAKMTKQNIDKEKTAQICRFFTLWGYFYPYIIGGEQSGNN